MPVELIELDKFGHPIKAITKEYASMPKRIDRAIVKALGSAGEEVKRAALKEPKRRGRAAKGKPVFTGRLVASITTEVHGMYAKVGPNRSIAPYGADIEFGTKSTTPAWPKFILWAKYKGIEEFACAIFRKLKSDGIQANPFLARAFKRSKKEVNKRFDIALQRALMEGDN